MGFDIPMKTKGACDLMAMAQGGMGASAPMQQPQMQPQQQMQAQNNFGQQQPNFNQPQQGGWNQPQQQPQQNWNNQPQQQQTWGNQNNGFNQQAQPQQSWNQPQQQAQPQQNWNNQPQQNYSQQPAQQNLAPKQRPQGGGVQLKKGQKVALAAAGQTLSTVQVCLGWDIKNQACDLDASAFMLDSSNRVVGDDWFVFYGQTSSPDGSVVHSGDSDGSIMGDDEIITIKLNQVNPQVQKIAFVVTINEALEQGLNFSMVANAYARVVDKATGKELNRFMLTDYYANVTSMVVGELYRHNGQWKFNAVGDGVAKDLAGLCAMYGVNVAD